MGVHGSLYGQFRKAVDAGQTIQALALASELTQVGLDDALDLCVLLAGQGHHRYEAAARRWLQRFAGERSASLNEVLMAGAALAELGRSPGSQVARDTLEQLLAGPAPS